MKKHILLILRKGKQMRTLFLACMFLAGNMSAFSQDKPSITFGKVSAEDFNLPKSDLIDSNTNAVIIADVGSISFVGNKNGWFSWVFKRTKRIKILNSKAINLGTVNLLSYHIGEGQEAREEKISDISAATYNFDNGKLTETILQKNDIFQSELSKYESEKKIHTGGCEIWFNHRVFVHKNFTV